MDMVDSYSPSLSESPTDSQQLLLAQASMAVVAATTPGLLAIPAMIIHDPWVRSPESLSPSWMRGPRPTSNHWQLDLGCMTCYQALSEAEDHWGYGKH